MIWIKLLCNFIEITLWHGCCPVNLLKIFTTPFYKNTYGGLHLKKDLRTLYPRSKLYEKKYARYKNSQSNRHFSSLPASIYLIKVNIESIKTMCEICSKLIMISLTFNKFNKLLKCFHWWLWTSKCWLGLRCKPI